MGLTLVQTLHILVIATYVNNVACIVRPKGVLSSLLVILDIQGLSVQDN